MENRQKTENEIKRKAQEIEQEIMRFLPPEEGRQKIVIEAMRYSFLSGGKRLRPMLMKEAYQMFGGVGAGIGPFMAAIEMVHTYSLIHDDLPAMDNDEYRRGRKTTHIVYGEAMGILAGDALLNFAFETAAKALDDGKYCGRTAKAMQILAKKAGIYGMLGGQAVDVQNEGSQDIDGDTLGFIYQLKTGALLEASMMIGAVLAGAGPQEERILEQAAGKIGIAFQIQDDILDVEGTLEDLGKPSGSDEKNNKVTYVSMHGMDAAKKQVARLTEEALACMGRLPYSNEFLNSLLLSLVGRKH